ncbi:hypothetical protein F4808DRAFT_461871 [Astrocystis sublimbata]|nr:hypothetical protein F4808DRAFT_461871 [Astrocystis sublimbata]
MKSTILLLAASGSANAAWLRWSVNSEAVRPAQETGRIAESTQIGWTPIPTPAPGVRSDGEVVIDLLKRQRSKTDWTNSETCGWVSGISSSAIRCGDGFTCATNSDHAVACASGTISPFFTACLDYSAFKAGSCDNLDAATGCCQAATEPACGTYIWTGAPERFMYKCFEKASIVSVLDVPQFVLDASLFSKTHTTPTPKVTPTETASNSNSDATSAPESTGSNPVSGGSNPASGSNGSDGSNGSNGSDTSNETTNNTPAIVGGAVGGIAGLLFLLLLLWCCLRRNKNSAKGKLGLGFTRNKTNQKQDKSSKAYHTTNVAPVKGRNSSVSEGTAPATAQSQRSYHYHNNSQHSAPAPQSQGPPTGLSYTVNNGPTYATQTSYPQEPMRSADPASSGTPSRGFFGAIFGLRKSKDKQQKQEKREEPYYQQPPPPQAQHYYQQMPQQQQQQQQDGAASQPQPINNHIHIHYAPPTQAGEQQRHSRDEDEVTIPAYYGQVRDVSADKRHDRAPSPEVDEWLAARGPGYRQSF